MLRRKNHQPLVAILTDFGNDDAYVGIMKAVMRSYNRSIDFIDLTHNVTPYSIQSAAYLLFTAWDFLPAGTVLLGVIDPGVGSKRRELVATCNGKYFVGPDNGLVSLLAQRRFDGHAASEGVEFHRASDEVLQELNARKPTYSHTFDGRDLFAPLAARIATNGISAIRGPTARAQLLDTMAPIREQRGIESAVSGTIIHVDHFGNAISSIHLMDLALGDHSVREIAVVTPPARHINAPHQSEGNAAVRKATFRDLHSAFSEVPVGESLAYIGSAGFLEFAVRNGSAESTLGITIGDVVELSIESGQPRVVGPLQ